MSGQITFGFAEKSSNMLTSVELLTQPPDPGRSLVESVRLSFLFGFWVQGPVSGAPA